MLAESLIEATSYIVLLSLILVSTCKDKRCRNIVIFYFIFEGAQRWVSHNYVAVGVNPETTILLGILTNTVIIWLVVEITGGIFKTPHFLFTSNLWAAIGANILAYCAIISGSMPFYGTEYHILHDVFTLLDVIFLGWIVYGSPRRDNIDSGDYLCRTDFRRMG